ncbi:MAG: hypothetical protein ACI9VR_000442 [Cognaticolwellia sp.]|jgi:hypothetical protein
MLLVLTSLALAAEPASGPTWTVTVDPLTTALGYVHLQVEHRLSPHTSLYIGPHMRLFDGILTAEPEPFVGFGAEAGFRYFFKDQAPQGTWVMARGVLARLNTTYSQANPLGGAPSQSVEWGGYGSALVGYTAIFKERWVLSGGAGFNYLAYDIDGMGASGPFVALHTNLGVAF